MPVVVLDGDDIAAASAVVDANQPACAARGAACTHVREQRQREDVNGWLCHRAALPVTRAGSQLE